MIEHLIPSLLVIFKWPTFGFMLTGIFVGFWVGILPGIGGPTTIALMLPFIYDMTPVGAFAFLLGMVSVVATTGDITSVLFSVPGEGVCAATVLDGYPMAKRGEAGRALGAVLFSSLVGALFGAIVLLCCLPIVRPLVLSFGSPELFMTTVVALTFIGALTGKSVLKGMMMGGLGLCLSMIGMESQSSQMRYVFGTMYLWDGLSIVPVVVGLFGIPEIIELSITKSSIADVPSSGKIEGVMEGIKDTFRYWFLTIRCSAIGSFMGLIPGLGSGISQWVVYAHAKQTSRKKGRDKAYEFGNGAIEGVLGPGASNNASMGGALIPTLAFGIPGGTALAVLMGAFRITGLVPGPDMLTTHLDVTLSMFWVLVVSNIITVTISLLFVNQLARITLIKSTLLIPPIILLIYIGGFTAHNSIGDLMVVLVFGLLGAVMNWLDWPKPPLILGLVLGNWSENYLYITTSRHGWSWWSRPIVIIALIIVIAAIVYPLFTKHKKAGKLVGEVGGDF
jgi:putative tricarboxylic transport membrane protein